MLELQTFGGLELRTTDGERVDALAGRTKCLALLAYLAVEAPEGRVPREKVAPLLWPDRTDELSRASLRVALSQIRQATDATLVAGEGASSLGLVRDHVRADVTAFREALEAGAERRALELYGGDFLAGVRVEGARPFRRWADRTGGRLRQRAYEAARSVGSSAREAGDLAAAEDAFRRALDLAPLREEAAAKLIRTLAERGRPADALQLYEAFRERREEELDMAPSDELRRRVEELKEAPPAASGAEPGTPAVEETPSGPGGSPAEELEGGPARTSAGASGRQPPRRGLFRRPGLVGAVVAVGLLGVAAAGAWHLLDAGGGAAAAGAGDRSVAVLPFEPVGAGEPEPIAEGLHNALITRLSNVSGLDVISATSVERFRDTDLPLPAVAESLGVTWVVEGDVQRAGGAIQVNAQLVDPHTDTHAWAETYRRELTPENLFGLQGEVAGQISRALKTEIGPRERERVERRPTDDLEAYRLFARGRGLLARRTDSAMHRAEGLFRRAIRRDSGFAPAWAELAKALVLYPQSRDRDPDSVFPAGREAARRALELDPDLAEAHMAFAIVDYYRMRGPASFRRLRRALALDPSYAMAHHGMNLLHLVIGRPEEALRHAQRAVALGPMGPENLQGLALASSATADYKGGLRAARRAREIEPDYGGSFVEQYALFRLGELPPPDSARSPGVGSVLAALAEATSGDTARARDLLATLEDTFDGAPNRWTGLLHAALGHEAEAIETFEAAFRRKEEGITGGSLTIALRYYFPDVLGPLRDDPRWERLVRQIDVGWGLAPDGSLPDTLDVASQEPADG